MSHVAVVTWFVTGLFLTIGVLAGALITVVAELRRQRLSHDGLQRRHDDLYERWQYLATHPEVAPVSGWPARGSRNSPLPGLWARGTSKPRYMPEGWMGEK